MLAIIKAIRKTLGYNNIAKVIPQMIKTTSTNMHVALSQSINSFFIVPRLLNCDINFAAGGCIGCGAAQ